jgi:hypothetical protein
MTDTGHAPPSEERAQARLATERISVSGAPERLQLLPGAAMPMTLLVANQGSIVDQFTLTCSGVDPQWITVQVGEATLLPDAESVFQLSLRVPDQPPPSAKVYTLQLTVDSRAVPGEMARSEVSLEVLPIGGIELELRPSLVRTRGTARYTASLKNHSNTDHELSLVTQDPNEALELSLSTARHRLDVGGECDVEVRARPRKRQWVGVPAAHSFRVLALLAGDELAEPLGGADGTLIYRPPLAFLAFIPLWLRRLLLALLVLLALAALLIWLLFGPGSRIAGPPAVPTAVSTPAAAAASNEEPPAEPAPVAPPAAGKPAAPPPPAPVIDRFEVVAPATATGDFQIAWDVSGADEVKLRGEPREARGSEPIRSLVDDSFELEASNAGGTVKKSIGILLLRPPEVLTLDADRDQVRPGEAVVVSWSARGAQRASIEAPGLDGMGPVDPRAGSTEVRPQTETTVTLTAENELGRTTRALTIRVTP